MEQASEGEHCVYAFHAQTLRLAGCSLPPPSTAIVGGVKVDSGPRVVLGARFRPTVHAGIARLAGKGKISLTARSALHVDGDVTIHSLDLDGSLRVSCAPGAKIVITSLRVRNGGARLRETVLAYDFETVHPLAKQMGLLMDFFMFGVPTLGVLLKWTCMRRPLLHKCAN